MPLDPKQRLLDFIGQFESCVVAFSGGVDSAVVAQATRLSLGEKAIAVTGTSPSLAEGELAAAAELAVRIGIRHEIVETAELANPAYAQNEPDRCYHCKDELYDRLDELAGRFDAEVVLSGANADDLGDYRPGLTAAAEHRVRHPLAECGIGKSQVRELARHWELPVAEKPASPCLSSRIAYGQQVTPERLARIDRAERFLREAGLGELRVRLHEGELARVEVPQAALPKLVEPGFRKKLIAELKSLGFQYVTLDLEGFRSGSQNVVLQISPSLDGRGPG